MNHKPTDEAISLIMLSTEKPARSLFSIRCLIAILSAQIVFLAAGLRAEQPQQQERAEPAGATSNQQQEQSDSPKQFPAAQAIETVAAKPWDGPRDLLALFDMDDEFFSRFADNQTIEEAEKEPLLQVLYRMMRFKAEDISRWTRLRMRYEVLASDAEGYRTQMFGLSGRLVKIERWPLTPEQARRLEMAAVYQCHLRMGKDDYPILLVTPHVPRQLPLDQPINERVTASGLFLKVCDEQAGKPQLLFLAQRIAWHPDKVTETVKGEGVNYGMTLLADQGMDIGLLDQVQNRKRIRSEERECFYQMLWAVEKYPLERIEQLARRNLDRVERLAAEKEAFLKQQLAAVKKQTDSGSANASQSAEEKEKAEKKLKRALLLNRQVLKSAAAGKYSVYPFFNQADQQQGRLVSFTGTARRALEIQLDSELGQTGTNTDIVKRFGLEKYYEVEIFTADSQDNPIVFCLLELPSGFPTGEDIHEPVQIAGFFMKTWAYRSQQTEQFRKEEGKRKQQLAPLLVGRGLRWLPPAVAAKNRTLEFVLGFLFLLAVAGVWLSVWYYSRSDKKFKRETLSRQFDTSEGVSLDEILADREVQSAETRDDARPNPSADSY